MNIGKFSSIIMKNKIKYAFLRGEDDRKMKKYQIKQSIKLLKKRRIKYANSKGYDRLINLITKKEKVNKDNVIILQGSTLGVFYFFLMMEENKRVMICRPYYPLYKELAIMMKKSTSFLDLSINNFDLTFDYFIKNLKDDIKYVIINTPHNPTGKVFDYNEIEKIINYCEENKIYVLLDLVYEDIVYKENNKIMYKDYKYIILLKSFSKSYNMTGVRIGYIIGTKSIVEKYNNYLMNSLVSIPIIPQEIAYSSLKKNKIYTLKKYIINREIVKKFIDENNLEYISLDGSFYVFINIEKYDMTSYEFSIDLAKRSKVAVLPGSIFGDDRYIRIGYMVNTKYLKRGLKRISDYLKNKNSIA